MLTGSRGLAGAARRRWLESEQLLELPAREALSYVAAGWADDLVAYANATQSTAGSSDTTTASVGTVQTGAVDTAVAEAQNSSTQQNGAVAQNVNSPSSSAFASTRS